MKTASTWHLALRRERPRAIFLDATCDGPAVERRGPWFVRFGTNEHTSEVLCTRGYDGIAKAARAELLPLGATSLVVYDRPTWRALSRRLERTLSVRLASPEIGSLEPAYASRFVALRAEADVLAPESLGASSGNLARLFEALARFHDHPHARWWDRLSARPFECVVLREGAHDERVAAICSSVDGWRALRFFKSAGLCRAAFRSASGEAGPPRFAVDFLPLRVAPTAGVRAYFRAGWPVLASAHLPVVRVLGGAAGNRPLVDAEVESLTAAVDRLLERALLEWPGGQRNGQSS